MINIPRFVPFGFLLAACLSERMRFRRIHVLLIAVALGAPTPAGIETVQIFLPARSSTVMDVLADTPGSGIGAFWVLSLSRLRRR